MPADIALRFTSVERPWVFTVIATPVGFEP